MPLPKPVVLSDDAWRARLTPMQYHVLRQSGTERAFTGPFLDQDTPGTYTCAGCATPLFRSTTKFHSGCGWPSFYDDLRDGSVTIRMDRSHGMVREEIRCAVCDGHLGHVFNDGPRPTGRRYCVNGAALAFVADSPTGPAR